jgi:biotin operon repressor
MDAKDKVLEVLKAAGKPLRPGDVATAAGLGKDDVAKAIDALKKEGAIHSPQRCFYAPAPK